MRNLEPEFSGQRRRLQRDVARLVNDETALSVFGETEDEVNGVPVPVLGAVEKSMSGVAAKPALRLTWDTNCVISIEEADDPGEAENREALEQLLALHDQGRVEIRIPAAMASETQNDGSYALTSELLRARFAAAGLERLASLPEAAPIVSGQAFWGQMAFADDRLQEIFAIMFPAASFDGPRLGESETTWWGRRIDAAVYWGHINSGGELLVTADRRGFIRGDRRARLLALGGHEIATPVDAVEWVDNELRRRD